MVNRLNDRDRKRVITHRIACGIPGKKSGGRPVKGSHPSVLDHFLITGMEEREDGQYEPDNEAMRRVSEMDPVRYGKPEKLRRIPIRVTSDRIEDFMVQKYASRRSMPVMNSDGTPVMSQGPHDAEPKPLQRLRIWCEGDGKVAARLNKDGTESVACLCNASPKHKERTRAELEDVLLGRTKIDPRVDTMRCPYAQLSREAAMPGTPNEHVFKKSPICKPETFFIFRCDAVASLGVFARFRSHGHHTSDRLMSSIEDIKTNMPGGLLTDIPLDLCLQMVPIGVPGTTVRRPQPVVHVELRLSAEQTVRLVEQNLRNRMQLAAAAEENRRLLQAAVIEVDQEDVEGEFVRGRDASGGIR